MDLEGDVRGGGEGLFLGQGRGDLVDGADMGVGRACELVDVEVLRRVPTVGDREATQARLGQFERPCAVLRVHDQRGTGGEDPWLGPGGEVLPVGLDDGELQFVQRCVPGRALRARLGAGEQQTVPGLTGADTAADGERRLPDPSAQVARIRIDPGVGPAHPVSVQGVLEHLQMLLEDGASILRVVTEGGEGARGAARGDAQLDAPAADPVQHRRILGRTQRVVDRQGDHAGGQGDVPGALGGGGEQDQGRGQAALVLAEVVLGEPRGGEPEAVGRLDLLEGEPVSLRGGRLLEQAGEESQAGRGHAEFSSV
jgi:hypothetical protein